jgi:hypothetical protein
MRTTRQATLTTMKLACAGTVVVATLGWTSPTLAEPVSVRYLEGLTRGFPVVRSPEGEKLAQGDLTQVATSDKVESRMLFRFKDGSYYDETVVFSQREVFRLLSYRLIQRGPSFPETIEAWFDRETQRYEVRYKADEESSEEIYRGRFEVPEDVYNGMLTTLMKNLAPGAPHTVQIVAFTPKPRAFKMQLAPAAEDAVLVGDAPMQATRYRIRPQLGLLASLLVSDLPDLNCWIVGGTAPAFVRFEGPLYFQGPVWRIEPN